MTVIAKPGTRQSSPARRNARRKGNETTPVSSRLPHRASARKNLWISVALALLTLIVYSSLRHHPFVDYDDQSYVTENKHVQDGLSWDTFTWSITSTEASNWHPVTWLSHALDCQLYGLEPSGHHWTSLLIHMLNVILLFLLLERVTLAKWKSAFVAALFALHPLNVESVAWIAERKNVLSTFFFLLALGAYAWYARRPGVRRYSLLALLFALGLAAKPMVITLPFVLLLLDYWPLQRIEGWIQPSDTFPVPQRPPSRVIVEKLPLLALSAGSAVLTIVAQSDSVVSTQALPFGVRLATVFYAYGVYLWKLIWPVGLALIYPHPGRTLAFWKPFLGTTLILSMTMLAWQQRKRQPWLLVGWLWYLGTAVPIIGVMQVGVQVVADRYAYVPLIGIFLILVWGLALAADAAQLPTLARALAASCVIAVLACLTWKQAGYWRSSADLWSHAIEVTTNNSMAENFLANTLFKAGRYQEGMAHLRVYAAAEPLDPEAHVRVGADYQDRAQLPDAAREYEQAIHANAIMQKRIGMPGLEAGMLAVTYMNLGLVYAEMGDSGKAVTNAQVAIATDKSAIIQMIQQLAQAVTARPSHEGYTRLGLLLQLVGHADEAQQAFAQARQFEAAPSVIPNPKGQH